MPGIRCRRNIGLIVAIVGSLWPAYAQPGKDSAVTNAPELRDSVPQTISPEARAIYQKLLPLVAARRSQQKIPQTLADFDANYAEVLARAEAQTAPLLKMLGVTSTDMRLGDVGVL